MGTIEVLIDAGIVERSVIFEAPTYVGHVEGKTAASHPSQCISEAPLGAIHLSLR